MRSIRISAALFLVVATVACSRTVAPPLPSRPTAIEQCRADVARKREECQGCWVWLWTGPYALLCYGGCGSAADALERQCNAYAFEAEHTSRIQADVTVHPGAPQ